MNPRTIEGDHDGAGLAVGVAVALFNQRITEELLAGCLEELKRCGVQDVTVMRVPGAWELPLAAKALIGRGCQAVVAVGAIIKGETDHYEVIVQQSAAGLRQVSLETGVPVANAVLTVHDLTQALDRSVPGPGNKGAEAATAAVEMARALSGLG